jgi:hypothetical protein
MKSKVLLIVSLFFCCMALSQIASAEVAIDATNFPDATFRKYVTYWYDKDKSGGLSADEITNGKTNVVLVAKYNISSVKGIEYLTSVNYLQCTGCPLTTADLSSNTNLAYINFGDSKLETINLGKLAVLDTLLCPSNQLTSIDVSQCPALKSLDVSSNKLNSLDLSKNDSVTILNATGNGRTIKVKKISNTDGNWNAKGGYAYYVETGDLETLIGDGFKLANVVKDSWGVAKIHVIESLNKEALMLNPDDTTATYDYNTGFAGSKTEFAKVNFGFKWSVADAEAVSGVAAIAAGGVKVYAGVGTINVVGANGAVMVYNQNGQSVYNGIASKLTVPAGLYFVKVNGKVYKTCVR